MRVVRDESNTNNMEDDMAENGKTVGVPIRVRLRERQMVALKQFRRRGENLSEAIRRGLDVALLVAGAGNLQREKRK